MQSLRSLTLSPLPPSSHRVILEPLASLELWIPLGHGGKMLSSTKYIQPVRLSLVGALEHSLTLFSFQRQQQGWRWRHSRNYPEP